MSQIYYVYVVIRILNSAYPNTHAYKCIYRKFWLHCFRSAHMCICVCMCVNVCVHVYDFCIFCCVSVRLSHGMVYASLCMCCLTCTWNVKSIQVLSVVSNCSDCSKLSRTLWTVWFHVQSRLQPSYGWLRQMTFDLSVSLSRSSATFELLCTMLWLCNFMLPALHAPFIAYIFLTIYTLSCQWVRYRIHSSISPRTFEHESYQTEQRRHTVYTILVCMPFPHHLYSKLPISWMQDKRRNASTSTALYIPLIL